MLRKKLFLFILVCGSVACGGGGKKDSLGFQGGAGGKEATNSEAALTIGTSPDQEAEKPVNSIDIPELWAQNYSVVRRLNFLPSFRREYVLSGEANSSLRVARYSHFFQDQRPINPAQSASADEYCEIFVEAELAVAPGDIYLRSDERLAPARISHALAAPNFSFTLALQASPRRQVLLHCKNVASAEGLRRQVGNVIQIRPTL